jgi:hypothetical protein
MSDRATVRYIVKAGGQPWIIAAALDTQAEVDDFCARHRAIHPSCPLEVEQGLMFARFDILGTEVHKRQEDQRREAAAEFERMARGQPIPGAATHERDPETCRKCRARFANRNLKAKHAKAPPCGQCWSFKEPQP